MARSTSNRSELEIIPGVGKSIAADLHALGIYTVADLKGKDPEALYRASCQLARSLIDRCLLYTYRCAVYYAGGGRSPAKLKWWNWKDPR